MSLDFRHTCPEIDYCISDAELIIEEHLKDLIEQFLPSDLIDVTNWRYKEFLKDSTLELFSNIKPLFEELRSLNSEMRDKADEQINNLDKVLEWRDIRLEEIAKEKKDLEDEIHILEQENNDLEVYIVELKDENKALGYRVSELEDKIIELNGR